MKKVFNEAFLTLEYWNKPEKEKDEVNPHLRNDPDQKYNPFIKSAKADIPEELVPELIEFLEEKGVFMGHVRGVMNEYKSEE